jgi:ADP-heptose:LPS heptosyltransferase
MRSLRNIVIVREDRLGDMCLSLPVLEALLNLTPETRATWICQPQWTSLVDGHPSVERVLGRPRKPTLLQAWKIGAELRSLKPDAILLLRASKRWQQVARFSGTAIRIGHTARPPLGLLTEDAWIEMRRRTHVSRRGLDVLSTALNLEVPDFPAVLRPTREAAEYARHEIDALNVPSRFFAVQLGTGGTNAGMPPEFFAKVAREVTDHTGLQPVLTGAKGEEPLADEFNSSFGVSVRSTIGRTTVMGLCELVKRATCIISGDTGTVHVGAAVETPSVVVMPKLALSVHEWRPWMVDQEIVTPTAYCPQCSRTGCRGDRSCVRNISPTETIAAALKLLERTAERGAKSANR